MSTETIGYSPTEISKMPETRQNYVEAKFSPNLDNKDKRLNTLTSGQLDFFASVLS